MGAREFFVYSTNPRHSIDALAKALVESKPFNDEFPLCWLVCKAIAQKDLNKDTVEIFGNKVGITPIHLKEGQEALCVGCESCVDVEQCFPRRFRNGLVVIEGLALSDMKYTDIWKDEPIVVNGQRFFAELEDVYNSPTVDNLIASASEVMVVRTMAELKDYLEDNGWQVLGGHTAWLVVKTSPAGEDVQFTILHNDDVRRAIHEIKLFACEFDIDKHVNKWIEARNNNNYYSTRLGGLPSEKEIAADAVAIKEMLNELAYGVKSYEQKSIGETLANAQTRSEKHNSETVFDINKNEFEI